MTAIDLISEHIEEMPVGARLRKYSVEVWILVAQLPYADGDLSRLAADYAIPREALEAALAYYRRHKKVIDAQTMINAA